MVNINHAAILGKVEEGVYKQIFLREDYHVLVLVRDHGTVDLEFGRNLVAKIEEAIEATPGISPQEVVEIGKRTVEGSPATIFIMAIRFHNQKMSLFVSGDFNAKLIRGKRIINLVNSGSPASISGGILHGDFLMFGSNQFFDQIDLGVAGKRVDNIEDLREQIAAKIEVDDNAILALGELVSISLNSEPLTKVHGATNREKEEIDKDGGNSHGLEVIEKDGENDSGIDREINDDNGDGEDETDEKEDNSEEGKVEDERNVKRPIEEADSKRNYDNREHGFEGFPGQRKNEDGGILNTISGLRRFFRRDTLRVKRELINEEGWKKNRRTIFLVLTAVLFFVCIIAFQLRSRVVESEVKIAGQIEANVNEAISSVKKLGNLNDQIARETLLNTKSSVEALALESFGKDWQLKRTGAIDRARMAIENLNKEIFLASRIYNVSPTIYSDLSLLKSGVRVIDGSSYDRKIFLLDQANGAIYSISTETKTAAIVAGSESLKTGKYLDNVLDRVFIFADKVQQTKVGGSGITTIAERDNDWGNIFGIKTFAGNVYLLDVGKSQIWKYGGSETGFASKTGYLVEGLSVNFSNVIDFAIDGSVYVLSKNGVVTQFSSGAGTEFKLTGEPETLTSARAIFTTDETQNIYILDKDNKRVVVFDKKGVYVSQYRFSDLREDVVNIVASEEDKKLFLITSSKLFAIDLISR